MKRFHAAIVLALFAGALLPTTPAAAVTRPGRDIPVSVTRSDRVLIHWATRIAGARPQQLSVPGLAHSNAHFLRVSGSGASVYQLDRPLGQDADSVLDGLRSIAGVQSVEPDLWMTADALPNDSYASSLWGLLGPGDVPASPYGVDALSAWPTTRGAGVVVAVIDTGIVTHPDLAGQTVPGYDMVSDTSVSNDGDGRDADPSDPGDWCPDLGEASSWHGTHVAGTIAALANNSMGVFGGAPEAKIEPVRVLGTCGGYVSDIADGIRWASGVAVAGTPANANPARVLNLSLGGPSSTCPYEYQSAISAAKAQGSVVVVSAGNDTWDASRTTPANCADAITVAATTSSGTRASFSNFGAAVDLAGPGVNVLSTVNNGATTPTTPAYKYYGGTSMASPHVSLSAALVAASHPTFSPDAIEAVLKATATPVAADGSASGCPTVGCGAGIVNAGRAITRLASGAPVVGLVKPSPLYPVPSSSVTVTAVAADDEGVASASVRIGSGSWVPMSAADGAWGGLSETVTATLPVPGPDGPTTVCVSATDLNGHTSDGTACSALGVDDAPPTVSGVTFSPAGFTPGNPFRVAATASDTEAVTAAEMRVDTSPWRRIEATDGLFNSASEAVAGGDGIVTSAVTANFHSCAVGHDGSVWCWGTNDDGEIGDGTDAARQTPVRVIASGAVSVSTSMYTSCALLADATVKCWGYNGYAELGDGTWTTRKTPVTVSGLTGATAVVAGPYHACAILADTTVKCWGFNDYGEVGDGTVSPRTTPATVSGLSGVVSIGVGNYHTCAVRSDGTVWCWGRNGHGQLGNGTTTDSHVPAQVPGLTGATAVSAGDPTCALLSNGTVSCWGPTYHGDLGDGANTERHSPVAVSGLSGATAIAVGWTHACALTAGAVKCWGDGTSGQLGASSFSNAYSPVSVAGLTDAVAISAGGDVTCAVRPGGTAACWGDNTAGELGTGTTGNQNTPGAVVGFGTYAAGSHQVCVRATDGAGHTSPETCATLPASGIAGAPAAVSATRGDGTATVSWSAAPENGMPVTSYTATSWPGGNTCTTATLSCPVSGLTNGVSYTFTVTATTDAGTGAASTPSNAVVPAGVPAAPGSVTALRRDGAVALSWGAAYGNGSPVSTYTVTSSPPGHGCSVAALSCVVEGLVNGTSYTFSVTATNGIGTGPATTSAAVVPAQVLARYYGTDRYATAADVSLRTFGSNCNCVAYIAYAFNFPDALAGAAAASKLPGPVLLVNTTGPIDASTASALSQLKPTKIVVLGSSGVISDSVYQSLSTYAPSIARYYGTDRYATAADVSLRTFGSNCNCVAYIAYAFNFPDALAGAAAASKLPGPVLLVNTTGPIDASTASALSQLKPTKIVVLGSSGVISDSVYQSLLAYIQ